MNLIQKFKNRFIKHPEEEQVLETIEEIMDEREERGDDVLVDEHELLLLKNLFKLKDIRANQVMIPRADIVGISDTATLHDIAPIIERDKFTRMPVYHKTLDNVVGVLHTKDLLCNLLENKDIVIKEIMNKSVLFVPPSIRALDLLREMQTKHLQMSVVIDEYGGTDGLITLEDLLEVIVGEIEDEHDAEDMVQEIQQIGSDTLIVDAKTPLSDIEEITGPFIDPEKLPDDIDTIGGLVFHIAHRLPHRGEIILHHSGMKFQVLDVDTRRIKKIRITNFRMLKIKAPTKSKGK